MGPTVPKSPTWLKRGKVMSARKPKLNPEQDCSEGRELKKADDNKRDFRKLRAKYAEYKKRAANGKANVSKHVLVQRKPTIAKSPRMETKILNGKKNYSSAGTHCETPNPNPISHAFSRYTSGLTKEEHEEIFEKTESANPRQLTSPRSPNFSCKKTSNKPRHLTADELEIARAKPFRARAIPESVLQQGGGSWGLPKVKSRNSTAPQPFRLSSHRATSSGKVNASENCERKDNEFRGNEKINSTKEDNKKKMLSLMKKMNATKTKKLVVEQRRNNTALSNNSKHTDLQNAVHQTKTEEVIKLNKEVRITNIS